MLVRKSRWLIHTAIALLLAATLPAAAQDDGYRAGRDYIELNPPLPVRAPKDKIEVLEFFNFSCPHCFRMQGRIAQWKKNNDLSDVELIHQPVVFQNANGHYARMFHTIDAMGGDKRGELYDDIFNSIHRKRVLLNSKGRFADWMEEHGFDGARAEKVYDSFSVNAKVNRDEKISDDYGVNSTPQMAVAGKYLITAGSAGSLQGMLDIATALIERERKLRGE